MCITLKDDAAWAPRMRLKSTGRRTGGTQNFLVFLCRTQHLAQIFGEPTIVPWFTALFSLESMAPLIHCYHTASSCCLISSPSRSCRRSLNTQLWQTQTGKHRYHKKKKHFKAVNCCDQGNCNPQIIFHLRKRPLARFFIWTPAGELCKGGVCWKRWFKWW